MTAPTVERKKRRKTFEPLPPLDWTARKEIADANRFESDAEVHYALAALRRGEPGAHESVRDRLEWIIYQRHFVPPTKYEGRTFIYNDERLAIAFLAVDTIVGRLTENDVDDVAAVTKLVEDEIIRAFHEEKSIARSDIEVPPSTNSTRKAKGQERHKSLRRIDAASLGCEDDDNDGSVAPTKLGLKSSANGTALDESCATTSGTLLAQGSDRRKNGQPLYRSRTNVYELVVDRRIDLVETREVADLGCRLSRAIALADWPQVERLYNERKQGRKENARILELADFGLSVNVIRAMTAIRGDDVVSRFGRMRRRAQKLKYGPPPGARWDYTEEQLFANGDNGPHKEDRPCAQDCGRSARCPKCRSLIKASVAACRECGYSISPDEQLLCWPCCYQLEFLHNSAQPDRPLLSDNGKPIVPGSLGVPFPNEFRRYYTKYLRRHDAHNDGTTTSHSKRRPRKARRAG